MKRAGAGIADGSRAAHAARRRSRGLVSVAAILLGVLIAISASRPQGTERRFSHRSHVSTHWYGAPDGTGRDVEYARDCRSCHTFGDGARDPLDVCSECHFDQTKVGDTTRSGWVVQSVAVSPAAAVSGRSLYRHEDHLVLACRECHPPASADASGAEMLVPSAADTGVCMRCHDWTPPAKLEKVVSDSTTRETSDPAALRTRLLAKLNADPALKAPRRGPFAHADHLRAAELASPERCAECHTAIAQADALYLATVAFDTGACGSCHVGSNGKRVDLNVPSSRGPSVSALTFAHRDHLRTTPSEAQAQNCTSSAAHDVAANGCLACHQHDPTTGTPDFGLRAERKGYDGCITCHDVERFKTKDHGSWHGCIGCHDFGSGTMKSNRLETQVVRAMPGTVAFVMPDAAHPGLAGKPAQACAECHKAALPAASSRVSGKRFDHAQHVARDPARGSCDTCHPARFLQPESRVKDEAAPLVTFDAGACTTCHPGASVDASSIAQVQPRSVPAFSHAQHMEKAHDPARPDAPIECTTCHSTATKEPGRTVGTLPRALDCTMCHQHDAEHARWTGGIQGSQVESCARCHVERMPTVAYVAPIVPRGSVSVGGAQFHPDDRACAACHIDRQATSTAPASAVAVSGALFTIHAQNRYPSDCRACHWAVKSNLLGDQSPTLATRKREGASMAGFPGGEGSDAMRQRFLEGTR